MPAGAGESAIGIAPRSAELIPFTACAPGVAWALPWPEGTAGCDAWRSWEIIGMYADRLWRKEFGSKEVPGAAAGPNDPDGPGVAAVASPAVCWAGLVAPVYGTVSPLPIARL